VPVKRGDRILIVDDEAGIRLGIKRFLRASGYETIEADSVAQAETAFSMTPPDAAILDQNLPDGSGVNLMVRLKTLHPSVPIVILTAHGSIDLAVKAIKEGADHFLTKPADLDALVVILDRLLESNRNQRKLMANESRLERDRVDPFRGTSEAIRCLTEDARTVLKAESSVLVQGETGTGKGVLARWLHQNGPRAKEPFVDLNCASLSRELLESELFGYEAGAFTGATRSKPGLFEVANRGVVFLDEIGDLELSVQPKLLTVIEEKRFRRLGDVRDRRVDVRLIAATHHDLAVLAKEKRFRSDLYFRISAATLRIPPLRERPEDIVLLAHDLLRHLGRELGHEDVALTEGAAKALEAHPWPGNIREMRNVLERALLAGEGRPVTPQDLRFVSLSSADVDETGATLTLLDVERRHIERVLRAERGHVARTAVRLGISKASLYQRMRRYGIPQVNS
jgi:DNA-binding NtrC family response regulator